MYETLFPRPEDLMNDIELAAGTPVEHQVIFSSQSDIYVSKNSSTSQNDFNLFMNRAGGSQVGGGTSCIMYMYVCFGVGACCYLLYSC